MSTHSYIIHQIIQSEKQIENSKLGLIGNTIVLRIVVSIVFCTPYYNVQIIDVYNLNFKTNKQQLMKSKLTKYV